MAEGAGGQERGRATPPPVSIDRDAVREALEDILQTIPSIRSLLDSRQGGEGGRSSGGDAGNGGTSTTANQGDNNGSGSSSADGGPGASRSNARGLSSPRYGVENLASA